MKKQIFAVCDIEEAYAYHLMEYLTERRSIPFEIMAFSGLESLRSFAEENGIEILLISGRMMCGEVAEMNINKIVILSEGEILQEFTDYPAVYKYQPSDHLVAEVMNYYAHQIMPQTGMVLKKNVQIIGVYSPVGRCGKTGFALTLGQILAQKKSILYLNLEEYSGFEKLIGREFSADISDVLYFIRQNKGNAIFKLNAVVQRIGSMDYIPPAFLAGDLREIAVTQWLKLLEDITSVGGYDVIVLDIGETVEDKFALLSCCTRIYMPVLGGVAAGAKLAQYERQIREMEHEEILEKTRRLYLPFAEPAAEGEYYLEQLAGGALGDYVRELLEEENGQGNRGV